MATIQTGYMLLADISGFSSFMEDTEIEHSATILNNLIELIIKGFTPIMYIAEVEGDAVFAYVPDSNVARGELLLELIENTYTTFRDQRQTMQHNADCPCLACQSIHTLDLKFVIHHGQYVLQNITGKRKPVGASVNIAHRLLKNRVQEITGWRGYALFTGQSLEKMDIHPRGMKDLELSYAEAGMIQTGSIDLNANYVKRVSDRRLFLSEKEADHSVTYTFSVPQPVLWDWLTDSRKRRQWLLGANFNLLQMPGGRTGPATQYHCVTSGYIEEILDWRPFHYYTVHLFKGRIKLMITSELEQVSDGIRLRWNLRWTGPFSRWIGRPMIRLIIAKKLRLTENFKRLEQLMAESMQSQPDHSAAEVSARISTLRKR